MRRLYHGHDFVVLATLTLVSSYFRTGTAREPISLSNEFCALRRTIVPIDQPSYRHFPYYVTLSRCSGSVTYISPRYKSCVPATFDEIKINVRNLENGQFTVIDEKNHTSCKPGCTNNKEMCNTQTQTWDENLCTCQCKYPNGPPEGCQAKFKWNEFDCACECDVDTQASLCLDEGKDWNSKKCGCDCPPRTVARCQAWGRVLDEKKCECTSELLVRGAQSGEDEGTEISKPMLVGIVFGELFFLLFIFDLYLYMKDLGLMYNIKKSLGKAVSREKEKSRPLCQNSQSSTHDKTTYL